jgi:hypothetical protein
LSSIANPNIDGTHKPIKILASLSPWNHNISENIRDKNAETNIKISGTVNFLNITLKFYFEYTDNYSKSGTGRRISID